MTMFITINPISKVVFFMLLTDGYTIKQKKKVIINAVKVSAIVLIIFAIFGKFLFDAFEVEFMALKFVGAGVIIKIGYDMLMGNMSSFKSSEEEKEQAIEEGLVGVVPLGIPMMAGPGAMIICMIYMGESSGPLEWGFIIFSIVLTCMIAYIFMIKSEYIYKRMGDSWNISHNACDGNTHCIHWPADASRQSDRIC